MVGELNYREAQESQWLASFQETSNRINWGRIYSQAASSSVSVDGPLWSPFDSLFPRIPAASHPWGGREQMAATQSSLVSTYNPPPQLSRFPREERVRNPRTDLSRSQADRWKNTQARSQTMLAGESTNSPQQPGPFPLLSQGGRTTAQSWGCRQTGWPSDQLLDHPILCEMLNSPYEWKMALEDGEKMRIQKEV